MITPVFEVDQNDNFVFLQIKTPYIKASEGEFYVNENEFKFYVKPYFLRLIFPGCIKENGEENASYDVDSGIYSVKLPKMEKGEFFPNLDLLTTLLAKRKPKSGQPNIEVISCDQLETENPGANEEDDDNSEVDDEYDDDSCWEVEQTLSDLQELQNLSISGYKYGFANRVTGVFARLGDEMNDVMDVRTPEQFNFTERKQQRISAEAAKFDGEHYLADFFDTEQIDELIAFEAHWDKLYKECISKCQESTYPEVAGLIDTSSGSHLLVHSTEDYKITFTAEEKEQLRQLPNKDYILDKQERHVVLLGLVDIIYAYAYDHRTTEGENTTESPWTICKLSTTLSWLQTSSTLHDTMTSSIRRVLCYSLYRNWDLALKVAEDTRRIFLLGRRCLLRCLLQVHHLLRNDERYYLLADLYITDYCVWLQKVNKRYIKSISFGLQKIQLSKPMIGLEIDALEMAGLSIQGRSDRSKSLDSTSSSEYESESSYDSDDLSEPENDVEHDAENYVEPVSNKSL